MRSHRRDARGGSRRGATLPVRASPTGGDAPGGRDYGRYRAACLAGVYVLMVAHVVHWKLAGKTLAPLELNEVMYTLELGIVTAGFLFMLAAFVATAVFGRFFCSWGCHMLALQDLCAWLLARIRIRPKPVRSRVLALVPPLAMAYMFIWPQVERLVAGRPPPALHVLSDAQGWASFMTSDFWRNLPGPAVTALTFAICGFAIVYVLGSRGFCNYGCPYGVLFRVADRVAAGRIVAVGDCSSCGACTAACSSQVRVHEELMRYGTVVNSACLKDLDCVAACPNDAVRFGFTRPPILRSWLRTRPIRRSFDFSAAEELLMAAVFLGSLLIFRGLYESSPFLMTLGLGGIAAYLSVVSLRLLVRGDVRLNNFDLKQRGRWTVSGVAFASLALGFAAFAAHSGVIRYHEYAGHRAADRAERAAASTGCPSATDVAAAIRHLQSCDDWGLARSPRTRQRLAESHSMLADLLAREGQIAAARSHLEYAAFIAPGHARIRFNLGVMLSMVGDDDGAAEQYRCALQLAADDVDARNNLALIHINRREFAAAQTLLERAVAIDPRHANARFNLARALESQGRPADAEPHFVAAAALDPQLTRDAARSP